MKRLLIILILILPVSLFGNVTRVGSWTTGLTHDVGAGYDRILVFAVGYENASDPGVTSITYGGQTLTRIGGAVVGTTTFGRIELWYLDEAGITAATGNTFIVTWGGTAPTNPMYGAATFEHVDQTTPIVDTAGNFTDTGTPNPITATVDVSAGGLALANAFSDSNGSFTWNNGWLEGIDQSSGATCTMSSADNLEMTAGTSTASATHTATVPNLLAIFTASLAPAANNPPVVSDIPDQTLAEGASFSTIDLDAFVSDVDDVDSVIVWTYSGNTELTVDITKRVATITAPDADWYGSETITFTATDTSGAFASDPAIFTLTAVNDAPVVADIPDQTVPEGVPFATISLDDYVNDIDNLDSEITWSYSGDVNLSISIDGNRIATITPILSTWNGSETITFTATDPDLLSANDQATFTVTANTAPTVSDIPDQSGVEGDLFTTLNLDDFVSDAENADSQMVWTYSGNTDLGVSIDANRVATITTPNADWYGSETITFTATDPGGLSASDPAIFRLTSVNDAPLVGDIPNQTLAEGASFSTINLDNYVSDVDDADSVIVWTYSGNSSLSVDITNRVATITPPDADWNGSETITFTATDTSGLFDSDPATFTLTAVNDAPVVSDIPDQTIVEGNTFATINLDDYVSDIDNADAELSWTSSGNNQLSVSIASRVATITTPGPDWNGSETITFTVTDPGTLTDSDPATFTVTGVNDAPVVSDIPDQTLAEGSSFAIINLDDYVDDVDNPDATLTWSYSGNSALIVSIINRVATVSAPNPDWFGSEIITFRATDDSAAFAEDAATFTLTAVNDAPVVSDIPNQTVAEGGSFTTINLDNYVNDVDNLDSEITWAYSGNLELGVGIAGNVATITIPNADWNGSETITFTASDPDLASDSDPATFTVTPVNDAPLVSDIPDQTLAEGGSFATINLDDYVSDIDNADTEINWDYAGNTDLIVTITDRVATVAAPNADWNGSETITFTAADPGGLSASDDAIFTLTAVNDAPVVSDIPDQTVDEGSTFTTITLDSYVNDVDNTDDQITWSSAGNTDLTVSIINRVATITIPNVNWNGAETITFTAQDPGGLSASDAATFTVNAVNDPPVVTDIANQTLAEGSSFATINLDDFVSDVDNADSELTWGYSGNVDLIVDITARVATITAPDVHWFGSETITFTASDPGGLSDSDPATFTLTAVNDAPVVSDIPDQTITEGLTFSTINLDDYVDDVDDADNTISWTYSGNTELSVSIASRVATITIPGSDWNGSETITFTAADPGGLSDNDAATFTVTAVNDAPVVSDIPDQTLAEGASFATINLDNYVSDVDDPIDQLNWTYSGSVELIVSINARVATITAPDADWNGSETITFTATDGGGLFDSDPATFTLTAVNDAPVVADIPDQTVDEGGTFATINLDDYVSDVDNLDSEIIWSYSGNTELTVDITARVATITIPGVEWNGSETITFTASDGLLTDSDPAVFTVSAINDAPVVTDIPDETIVEGNTFATINLDNYVSDIDNSDTEMTWTYSGNTDLTVVIASGVATITAPDLDWNGSETITFTATDPGGLFASDAATFAVTPVNDAPIISDIPDQAVPEGSSFASINLDDYVNDVDNLDSELIWSKTGNTELLVDITNHIATIIIPSTEWNGAETITFRATDPSGLFDEDAATFTVVAGNDPPVVTDIPDQTVDEGSLFTTINLDDYVSDIDNVDADMTWTYSGNTDLTVDITARVATITIPGADWYGSETITFTATDPLLLSDSDPATFTVNNINDAPTVSDIPDQNLTEGDVFATINLDDYVDDIDNADDQISWTFSGNIDLSVDITDRIATITTPDIDWNGSETITFTATDPGGLFASDAATFAMTAVNDAPVVSDIPDQTIPEGGTFATINLDNYVNDVDNADSEITWSYSGNTEYTVDITARVATITIPGSEWSGSETITFTASDPDLLTDSDAATFTVTYVNDAPVVSDIPDQTVSEGGSFTAINLDTYVSDLDNTDEQMIWSYSGNTELTISIINRVATISIPSSSWNGSETVTFTATDPGGLSDSDPVTFTVTGVNDAPVVSNIPNQTLAEGASFTSINLDDYVTDIDNLDSELTWTYEGNIALSVDITNHVATVTAPNPDWYGAETITFTATDPGGLSDLDPATFTLIAVNDAPVVTDIPDQSIGEGGSFTTINLDDYVSDVDNIDTEMTWSYSGNTDLIVSIVNRIATISTPTVYWNGTETITFTASDPGLLSDADAATFTVTPVNDAPVISDIPDQTISEGSNFTAINLDTYVDDLDNTDDQISWTYSGNIELTVSIINRVASISIPSSNWNGSETITFTATDPGGLSDSDPAVFTVTGINDAPVISNIPNQTLAEGSSFATISLDNYVSDIDNADAEMTWTYSGNSALAVDITDRVATITTPDADWYGSETIIFTATDPGGLSDLDAATFTLTAVNDAPVVSDIPDQTITEGQTFAAIDLDNFVSDVDNTDLEMTWSYSGNTDLTVDITNRVATIGIPGADWNGSETITFTATDPGLLSGEDLVTFTVSAQNDAPVVTDIPDQSIAEGSTFATITLDDYVSDIDNTDDQITWTYAGNTDLTVSITSRVATIVIPGPDWYGSETITFTATDPGGLFDSDPATFTVTNLNDAPVVADIPNQILPEGSSFATINLDDYVSDVDNADTEISWTYSGNTELTVDISNRIATITAPDADWNGSETITFTAEDPGLLTASDDAIFTLTAVNDAPVVSNIPDQAVQEGGTFTAINLDDYVNDVDNLDTELTWTYSGNLELIVDITSRVATVTIPNANWNGSETITFTATDPGLLSGSDAASFTVSADNDAPVVTDIPDQTIVEGSSFTTINLDDYVSDLDNTDAEMTWTASGNTDLSVSITNRVATITVPNADWEGAETITFTATDPGGLFDSDPAVFTVTNVNDAPIVSDIPNQSLEEGSSFATINLDNYVTDIDNADSEMTWTYSGNVSLLVDITNRVATVSAPNPDWYGSETITFTATDPGGLSDLDPATFTLTAVNDAPVVADIPDQSINEGESFATINLDDYVSDADNSDAELTWAYSGNTELTVSIVSRIATISAPSSDWNGSETITFTASDPDLLSDSDPATFTIAAVNDAPVISDIPDQTISEGAAFTAINLDTYVSDIDNSDAEMTWTYSGNIELTVTIINRVATITIPAANWNGSETITFTATDPGGLSDSDPAIFTVTGINDAPVVSDIPGQTLAEGGTFTTINLDDYVTDIDNADAEMTWTYSGNTALLVDITNRVATVTAPNPDWFGSETITFTATDPGGLSDLDPATFTLTAVNDAPVVSDIPDQTITEGSTFTAINLDDYVTDVDNSDLTMAWTYSGNTELTVNISNRVATITIPGVNWNGSETITFTATDPGGLFGSDAATFTVSADNDAPVVTDIPDQTLQEGGTFATINLDDYVSDIDNTDAEMIWTYSGNTQLTVDITTRIATITAPDINWNGSETITFTATDPGGLSDSDPATFTLTAVNDAPVVTDIPDQTVIEGDPFATINLDDYVSDLDNADSEITWTYSGDVNLDISIDANRVATITPLDVNWNGSEAITFTATDPGALSSSDIATFTVTAVNDAPVVSDIPDQTIIEGGVFSTISLDDYVSDADNADSEISWTYSGNLNLSVSIDANRVATITPVDPNWNGSETITFTATDPDLLSASDAATFTVSADNDAPIVSDIPDQTIAEGGTFTTISLDDYVDDIDNLDSEMTWTFSGNVNLDVSIDLSRVATITVLDPDWNGSEVITFTATDPGGLSGSDPATFTVTGVNDAPVVSDIPDQSVAEGTPFATISLDDYVTDIDNADSEITWTYSGDVNLSVSIDGSRVATITPVDPNWNGSETITFTATDPGALSASDAATFTISAENDPPIVADIPDQTVAEGSPFATIILDDYVSDVDNPDTEITWTFSGNVNLDVSIDVNRAATITALDPDWNGFEEITFTATDPGGLSNSDAATFTVTPVNDAPVVSDIPDQTIAEGATFTAINLDTYVSDVDNSDSQMNWTYSGNTELTVTIINRVATVAIPASNWNGAETITFTATDPGGLSDSDPATFTVSGVNDAPVVSDIPGQTLEEGASFATINLDDYVTDIDNTDAEMTWTYSGNSSLLVDITNRVATVSAPNPDWFGSETITFTATDPGGLSDLDPATFTLTAVNDAPVVSGIPDQTIAEGETFALINLDDYVSDVDNTDLEMTWSYSGNTELTVNISDRIATITIPNVNWNGSETIAFTAADPDGLTGSDTAVFAVSAANDAPVVTDIPDQTLQEGGTFATINLDDYVSDIDNTDLEMTWTYSGNTDLTVDITDRVATVAAPGVDWNGSETITFTATDPGGLSDSDPATFTLTAVNDAPVVTDIPDQTITEGDVFTTINLDDYVSDVDNADTDMSWTYSGNVDLTVDITSRIATITTPGVEWNGSETITFTATDPGGLSASDPATFTVSSVNDAPVLDSIGPKVVDEGQNLNFTITSSDPDGTFPTIVAENMPLNATLTPLGSGSAEFDFNPDYTQSGNYNVLFIATDGSLADSEYVSITVNELGTGAAPAAISDLNAEISGEMVWLTWSEVTLDEVGSPTTVLRYVIYRGTRAYFDPTALDSIGGVDFGTTEFFDDNLNGADVVGDTSTNYFYVVKSVEISGLYSANSNRAGEYDFQFFATPTTNYNLASLPFAGTGIVNAQSLVSSMGGSVNVLTVNSFVTSSQNYSAWFSAGFGNNFALTAGSVFQVNAAQNFVWSVAGQVPDSGSLSYQIVTTPTTNYSLIMIPFEYEDVLLTAQDVINSIPGMLNTLNNFVPSSQSYVSRFAAGFGTNFNVRAGRVYQANGAASGVFPAP